jgi:hypothetical protein
MFKSAAALRDAKAHCIALKAQVLMSSFLYNTIDYFHGARACPCVRAPVCVCVGIGMTHCTVSSPTQTLKRAHAYEHRDALIHVYTYIHSTHTLSLFLSLSRSLSRCLSLTPAPDPHAADTLNTSLANVSFVNGTGSVPSTHSEWCVHVCLCVSVSV